VEKKKKELEDHKRYLECHTAWIMRAFDLYIEMAHTKKIANELLNGEAGAKLSWYSPRSGRIITGYSVNRFLSKVRIFNDLAEYKTKIVDALKQSAYYPIDSDQPPPFKEFINQARDIYFEQVRRTEKFKRQVASYQEMVKDIEEDRILLDLEIEELSRKQALYDSISTYGGFALSEEATRGFEITEYKTVLPSIQGDPRYGVIWEKRSYVEGALTNYTNETVNFLSVQFHVIDKNGILLGVASDQMIFEPLAPGDCWNFRCYSYVDGTHEYKLSNIIANWDY
jgi:hypothetical protein